MRKGSFLAISIAILLVLCLPVAVFAAGELTPKRASIYGAIYDSGSSAAAFHDAPVYQVNDTDFCIVPDETYTGVSQIRLYFFLDVSSFNSIDIVITLLDSRLLVGQDGSFTSNCFAYNYTNGSFSNYLNLTQDVRMSKSTVNDLATYHFQFTSETAISRNMIMFTIPLAATVMGSASYYNFRVNSFYVNGIAVNDISVTETNEGFAEDISSLSQSENEWWQRVVMPDYDAYLDDPNIIDGSTDYRLVIREISFNNFLVPGMITLVFIMAFYGFLLYGKKG